MKEKLQFNEESETDESDRELQIAFQKGYLKPGLNVVQPVLKKTLINNVSGLKSKLVELKTEMDWIEKMDVTVVRDLEESKTTDTVEATNSTENDFHRECSFLSQAQSAVATAVQRLHKMKIPTKRPDDYFAEMVKSDQQMKKVREKLLNLQTNKQRSETARRMREERKFAANVQKEVVLERQRERRELTDAVKKHKKGMKDRLSEVIEGRKNQKSDKKQSFKNSKYGFGGQKKRSKWNTAESAADYSSFSSAAFSKSNRTGKREAGGGGGKKRKTSKKPQRLGKSRRAQMKNSQGRKRR